MNVIDDNNEENVKELLIEETFSLIQNSVKHLLRMKDQIPREKFAEVLDNSSNGLRTFLISLSA